MVAQQLHRRLAGFLERIKGAGQQHRDGAGAGHGLGAGRVEMLEMVGRQRLVAGGQLGAALVGQLLGVEADARGRGRGRR